jgi:glucose-1-phosphate adenylyltransferase
MTHKGDLRVAKEYPRFVSLLTKNTVALILAGGRGSRLKQLTDWRAKPAVPFGGKFRIIDFPLSNCMNSGIRRIGVVTQYKAHSMIKHVQRGWGFLRGEFNEFVELMPAQQRVDEDTWYKGTADAVYQNLDILRVYKPEFVLLLAGDHVYKMDYGEMIANHVRNEADMTVACIEVPLREASAFGVMDTGADGRVVKFSEKPKDPAPMQDKPDMALCSMGIYVFNAAFLFEQLVRDADDPKSEHDFGKNIIPHLIEAGYRVYAQSFNESCVHGENEPPYWRDVGTVDAYWQANIDLTEILPELDLYDRSWPIWTYAEIRPPAKFVHNEEGRRGEAISSLVSGDCIISGARLHKSLIFTGVLARSYSRLDQAVVLPESVIGRHARLSKVVIDRGVKIPAGLVVGEDPELDASRFRRTATGVCLITQAMLDKAGLFYE